MYSVNGLGVRWAALLVAIVPMAGCSFDRSGASPGGGDDASTSWDAPPSPDARVTRGAHVLLSEVKTGPDPLEFIEIYNPTCVDVDLSDYYLSDDPAYSLLPSWGDPTPNLGDGDAVVRFPAGSILPAQAVAVIARSGSTYKTEFGAPPDYALVAPGGALRMEFIARGNTEDMRLTASGEPVALFEWDGARDLVRDVDVVTAGEAPTAGHQLVPKQVLSPDGVDGPDPDSTNTEYREDTATMPLMIERDASTGSYARIVFEDAFEIAEGGNGIVGHDETSEDIRTTWDQDPGSLPTPGQVAESLGVTCE